MGTQGQPAVSGCGPAEPRCRTAAGAALLAFAVELDGQAAWAAGNWDFGDVMTLQRTAGLARERAGELAQEPGAVGPVLRGPLDGTGSQELSGRPWWHSPGP